MTGSVKNRIVEAAWELFYEKGYEETTIDDIIQHSHTSKGSFYYYFDSKDAFLSTLSTILDEKYEELSEQMNSEQNCFDKLMFLNLEAHKMIENKINVDLLASLYSTQLTSKGDRNLMDQNRIYYKLLTRVIDEGQKKGQISDEKSVAEITKYYALCERALITEWCLCRGDYSLVDYSREYFPIMMGRFRGKSESSINHFTDV